MARSTTSSPPLKYPGLLEALGAVVVHFSVLEECIRDFIFVASGSKGRGKGSVVPILTTGLAFKALVEKFGAIRRELGPRFGTPQEVRGLCAHLERINDDRNRLIHSVWPHGEGGLHHRYKMTADPKKGLRFNFTTGTIEDLNELVTRIVGAQQKVYEYVALALPPNKRLKLSARVD